MGCSSEFPSKGNAGGACGLLLTFPSLCPVPNCHLAFNPTVKDSNFAARGSQHFHPPTFQGSLSPRSTLALGVKSILQLCRMAPHSTIKCS